MITRNRKMLPEKKMFWQPFPEDLWFNSSLESDRGKGSENNRATKKTASLVNENRL
jgi:hypothetical protein